MTTDDDPKPVTYVGPAPTDGQHLRLPRTTPAGTLHAPSPAAVAAFVLFKAERQAAKDAGRGRAVYDRGDIKANIIAAGHKANDRRRIIIPDDVLAEAVRRHREGETWAAIAAEHGVAESTLWRQVRRAGRIVKATR